MPLAGIIGFEDFSSTLKSSKSCYSDKQTISQKTGLLQLSFKKYSKGKI
jgi:hypothetical protein